MRAALLLLAAAAVGATAGELAARSKLEHSDRLAWRSIRRIDQRVEELEMIHVVSRDHHPVA